MATNFIKSLAEVETHRKVDLKDAPLEVLLRFDSEVAAWVSGVAETVDYFG